MRSLEPPKIVRWLLKHFGCSPNNAALIGDLDERYRRGRSDLWYWRQAIQAIAMSFFKEVWTHKLLIATAILYGWTVYFYVSRFSFYLTLELFAALASWARFWRHDSTLIAIQISELLLWGILTGWLVARLDLRNQKAMVLAYAGFFAAMQTAQIAHDLLRGRGHSPFYIFWTYVLLVIVVIPITIMVGGGVFRTPNNDGASRNRVAVS
jgi:hypothetical protein